MVHAARTTDSEGGIALRIVNRFTFMAAICFAAACASPGSPPGGPVDSQAPQIVRVAPDSGRTSVRPREVIFQFDEVVSERPSGATSLNALFLISPRNGETEADWHRSEIAVHPRRGFKANTTYTINLLPGLSDLRGNTRNVGATTVFSTGASLATGRLSGRLFNWIESRVIARGLVEARTFADTSTVYVTATDSAGLFFFRNVPPGTYRVRGISDDNANRGLDPREPFDTAAVTLVDSAKLDLLAFVHDSIGTRLSSVNARDSVTLELVFDNPISTTAPLLSRSIRVRAPDSTDVPIVSTAAPPRDTSASAAKQLLPRPAPLRILIVHLARPLRPTIAYRVTVTDVQNLIGVRRTSEKEVVLPAAVPVVKPPLLKSPVAKPPDIPKK